MGGGGSRSTGREGGTREVSSSGRQRLAVHREGGCDRGGVVILREAEARGLPGGRVGPGRRRHPTGGGGSRSTGREGGTREVSSSGRQRLAVHREGGWDRESVILLAAEARSPPGGRVGPGRLAVYREGGWDREGVVIVRAAEARGPPGGRAGPRRCHPPGGRGSQSTGREGGTGKASSSGRQRLAVHREGGWDREGVILLAAEARGPPGEMVRPGRRHPPSGEGTRSTWREGGSEVSSSSGRRRLAVHWEVGWDREVVILRAAEALSPPGGRVGPGRRHPPGGGGSRSTGREDGTVEVSSSRRRRLAVHREGGCDRGGVILP